MCNLQFTFCHLTINERCFFYWLSDTNPCTAKIRVKAYNRNKEMHNDIAEILNELVNHPESVLSSPIKNETKNGLDKNNANPSSRKNVESLLERFVKENKQSKTLSTCIREESFGLFRAMKICHGVESCHIYSDDGCVVISVEFGKKEDKKRARNDVEYNLENKVKYTFKIFFTVASLPRPDIKVRILDKWTKVEGIGRRIWYKRNKCKYKLEAIF